MQAQNRLLDPWRLRLLRLSCCIFHYHYLPLGVLGLCSCDPLFLVGAVYPFLGSSYGMILVKGFFLVLLIYSIIKAWSFQR